MSGALRELPISLCRVDPALAVLALTDAAILESHAALRTHLPRAATRLAERMLCREILRGRSPPEWTLAEVGIKGSILPAASPPPDPAGAPSGKPLIARRRFVRRVARALRRHDRAALAALLESGAGRCAGAPGTAVPVIMTFRTEGTDRDARRFGAGAVVDLGLRIDRGTEDVGAHEPIAEDRRPLVEFAVDLLARHGAMSRSAGLRVDAGESARDSHVEGARWQIDEPASAALPFLLADHLLASRRGPMRRALLATGAIVDGRLAPVDRIEAKIEVASLAGAQVLLLHEDNLRESARALGVSIGSWRPARRGPVLACARALGVDLVGLPSVEPQELRPILGSVVDALLPEMTRRARILRRIAVSVLCIATLWLAVGLWLPYKVREWNQTEKQRLYYWLREPKEAPGPAPWYLELFIDQRLCLASAYNRRAGEYHSENSIRSDAPLAFRAATDHARVALEICHDMVRKPGPHPWRISPETLHQRFSVAEGTLLMADQMGRDEKLQLLAYRRARFVRRIAGPAASRGVWAGYGDACNLDGNAFFQLGLLDEARARLHESRDLFDRLSAEGPPLDLGQTISSLNASVYLARLEAAAGTRPDDLRAACERGIGIILPLWRAPRDLAPTMRFMLEGDLSEFEHFAGRGRGAHPFTSTLDPFREHVEFRTRGDGIVEINWVPGTELAFRFMGKIARGGTLLIVADGWTTQRLPIGGHGMTASVDARVERLASIEFSLIQPDGSEEPLRR